MDPAPRAPSKKQARRKSRANARLALVKDPKTERLKAKLVDEQVQSDEVMKYIDGLDERLEY